MRRNSGLRFAGATVGGPFWVLIKVSLLVFVMLWVAPFWLAFKLIQLIVDASRAQAKAREAEQVRSEADAMVAALRAQRIARLAEHERRLAAIRSQAYYSNRR